MDKVDSVIGQSKWGILASLLVLIADMVCIPNITASPTLLKVGVSAGLGGFAAAVALISLRTLLALMPNGPEETRDLGYRF